MNPPQQTPMTSCPPRKQLDTNQVKLLEQQGFTRGLINVVSYYINTIALRIWVIDNSASMQVRDGHRLSGSTFQHLTTTDCTRWDEAQDEVAYHAYSAGCFGLPTRFNVVNAPTQPPLVPSCFSVAEQGPAAVHSELERAKHIMGQIQPICPANPLAHHVRQIRAMLVHMAPQLSQEGKFVSIILATAGLPTDANGRRGPAVLQDFVHALRSLEGLPVFVFVRLCTDDETVLDFYNTLDAQLSNTNLSYDVIDDFFGEAVEVYLRNPWLTYSLPLHRFRQFGFSVAVFDELDERALNFCELRQFCSTLFDTPPLPDPAVNWLMFLRALHEALSLERMHFNPITKTLSPWIDLRRLHYVYGGNLPFPRDIHMPIAMQQQQQQGYPTQPATAQAQWQQQQQTGQHSPQQSQQPPPPRAAPGTGVSATKYAEQASGDEIMTAVKGGIVTWATVTPAHQHLRPIDQLLGTVPQTFPPAFGIAEHAYFKKWKPFAVDALQGRNEAVLKRAMRKTKFFLHPDKLPKDLTKEQAFLCKMLWDIVADAWEAFAGNNE